MAPIAMAVDADRMMLRAEEMVKSPNPPPEPVIRGRVRTPVMVGEALRTTLPVPVELFVPVPPYRTGSADPE